MELWAAFSLGLLGSLHCAGMCGPLVLAIPTAGRRGIAFLIARLLYNAGRITTYCALGFVFGLVGRSLGLAGVQRWVSIGLGLAILAGVAVTRLRRLTANVALPVAWLKSVLGSLLWQRTLSALYLLGVLNGLLPCGLVYVACAAALTTGGVIAGVEFMAWFGLGTVPMMLGLGVAGEALPMNLRLRMAKLVPFCLAIVAFLLILRGLSLGIPYVSPDLRGAEPVGDCH